MFIECPHCHFQNQGVAKFCNQCGARFEDISHSTSPNEVPRIQDTVPINLKHSLSAQWASLSDWQRISLSIAALLFLLVLIGRLSGNNSTTSRSGSTISTPNSSTPSPQQPSSASQPARGSGVTAAEVAIFEKIKERARRDHPNDYSTQKYVYDTQVEAYQYVKTLPDSPLMKRIQRDHPYDFSTQKYVYQTQMEAKEYMDSLPASKLKDSVQRRHPNDYSTQKYLYDRELEAREALK